MRDSLATFIRNTIGTGRVIPSKSKVRMRKLTWAEAENTAAMVRLVTKPSLNVAEPIGRKEGESE